ncbi:hypothetical protein QBC46DRAFT_378832 [Diplogelasinospora grovesii]|uniref:Secreted protein n=1 Tax=Diplogelasinospora grovesii TaxID=303347 RepID=A0AAN6S799_9PEZI|nr:hypothetical protein QBC46DRAFT_378832 [Diplogelasinospora grovesii]
MANIKRNRSSGFASFLSFMVVVASSLRLDGEPCPTFLTNYLTILFRCLKLSVLSCLWSQHTQQLVKRR